MFNIRIVKVAIWMLLIYIQGLAGHVFRDQTSPRTNTLFDDADDIQRQLDNEARDRIKCGKPRIHWPDITEIPTLDLTIKKETTIQPFLFGRMLKLYPDEVGNPVVQVSPKTIWVFHFPTNVPNQLRVMNPEHYIKKETGPNKISQSVSVTTFQFTDKLDTDAGKLVASPGVTPPSKNVKLKGQVKPHTSTSSESVSLHSDDSSCQNQKGWNYYSQHTWAKTFPSCGGHSQSPINLPVKGLLKARGARPLFFQYYNEKPRVMMMKSDGQRAILFGKWPKYKRPLIYGGAVHSRRYLFHSMTVHWPSEHRVDSQVYPVETQALFISAEYKTIQEAINGYPRDNQAILGISSLYKFGNHTHEGLEKLIKFNNTEPYNPENFTAEPLAFFTPPFSSYVCYQGSLTVPPCTETVTWFIRARALSVSRDFIESMEALVALESYPRRRYSRLPQPINDRKVFIFN